MLQRRFTTASVARLYTLQAMPLLTLKKSHTRDSTRFIHISQFSKGNSGREMEGLGSVECFPPTTILGKCLYKPRWLPPLTAKQRRWIRPYCRSCLKEVDRGGGSRRRAWPTRQSCKSVPCRRQELQLTPLTSIPDTALRGLLS